MTKFAGKYRIESNRWQYWDYSAPGQYFITICTAHRQPILGEIVNKKMNLSILGEIVKNEIKNIKTYHPRCIIDESVVMPNHIHLIIVLVETIHELSPSTKTRKQNSQWWHHLNYSPSKDEIKAYQKQRRKMLIPKIVGKLKATTSRAMNLHKNTMGKTNWQPNYHDHVIRTEASFIRIKNYIIDNPSNWENDKFYDA